MQPTDILVIGAGVNGLASALALAEAGLSVRVIDSGPGGQESSWAGAGILSALPPWAYQRAVTDLIDYSLGLWPDWLTHIRQHSPVDPEYQRCGMWVLDPADPKAAHAWCAAHPEQGTPAAYDPATRAAFWLPRIAQVRNPRLIAALRDCARAVGIDFVADNGLLDWITDLGGARIAAVQTAQGRLTAERYVVAAGAWSQNLLAKLAAGIEVRPIRGQIALLATPPGTLSHIVLAGAHYLVPRQDGLVLVGSTLEDCGFDKGTTAAAQAELLTFATRIAPALRDAPCVRHWAGLRPGSPDNIPSIGRHPEVENLYLNAGHFRYGVTMAPGSAQLLTDIILQRIPQIDIAPYGWPLKAAPREALLR
jgi:glycine oxidase